MIRGKEAIRWYGLVRRYDSMVLEELTLIVLGKVKVGFANFDVKFPI
jgi:hypothetical protein